MNLQKKVQILGVYAAIDQTIKKTERNNRKFAKKADVKRLKSLLMEATNRLEALESFEVDWDKIEADIRAIKRLTDIIFP